MTVCVSARATETTHDLSEHAHELEGVDAVVIAYDH